MTTSPVSPNSGCCASPTDRVQLVEEDEGRLVEIALHPRVEEGRNVMNLQQMQFIVETAKFGSISKAARNLHISQPNLSKAIRSLEDELHVILFLRNEKGVTLTDDGRDFLEYATAILSQFDDIKQRYTGKVSEQPTIRLSTNRLAFVTETLMEFYNDTLRGAERFSIAVREIPPQLVCNDIINGVANLAVISLSRNRSPFWKGLFKSQNIDMTPLFESKKRVLMHKDHPLSSLEKLTLDDLKKYPLIQALEDSTQPSFSQEIDYLRYKEFPKIIYAGERSVVSSFLNATDALYFTTTVRKMRRFYPDIVSRPLPDSIPPMIWEFLLLKLKSKQLSRAEHAFAECLAHLGDEDEDGI